MRVCTEYSGLAQAVVVVRLFWDGENRRNEFNLSVPSVRKQMCIKSPKTAIG